MAELSNDTLQDKPVNAATVCLLNQHNDELHTLLLCRANSRTVMNNAWVFPGGKLDQADLLHKATVDAALTTTANELLNEPGLNKDIAAALFYAACRETLEETGVTLSPSALQTWSRWITPNEPSMMKKRFDARFFVAAMPAGQSAVHDGKEATDSRWSSPTQALKDYVDNQIVLAPPQIMTLLSISQFNSVQACLTHAAQTAAYKIHPHVIKSGGTRILTYPGDTEHPEPKQRMPGPTRLVWNDNHFEPPGGFDQYLHPT